MSIFVTGDLHGGDSNGADMRKLSSKKFPEGKNLSKKDYVIILGDFGFVWSRNLLKSESYWIKWLKDKPWTTLWIDGNHENHEMIAELPQIQMFGSIVDVAHENFYHLKRGHIYDIDGKYFFTMGGAMSIDKESRKNGISWWREEIPSYREMDYGLESLQLRCNKVDYILAHTCPGKIIRRYLNQEQVVEHAKEKDPLCDYFNHLSDIIEYNSFYFGHWHDDWDYDKYHMLYQRVIQI